MALVAPSLPKMNTGYSINTNSSDDRDNGNGFEFTRRKKWPHLLLQELVNSSLFCLKPTHTNQGSSHSSASGIGWKMIYASPAVNDMLNQKGVELEGKDFFDLVFAPDQPQLQNLLTSLVLPTPPMPHQPSSNSVSTDSSSRTPPTQGNNIVSGNSHTIHVRMMADTPVVWELRMHSIGPDATSSLPAGAGANIGFGYGGSGALVPQPQQDQGDAMKGRAVWVMGRKAVETPGEDNGQSLDAFLELKLENERLREELKELQQDLEDEDIPIPRPLEPLPTYQPSSPSPSSPTPSSASSSNSSPALKNKPVKKRQKKISVPGPSGTGKGEVEGLHVCVTCGRTDSPEWRKGPLGPKTLCNACGLRWAKRNSTAPSRKEKKLLAEAKKQ